MASGDGALEALLSRLRHEQGAARRGKEAEAHEELAARAASSSALARRLALSEATREALERAVRGSTHALAAAESRAAAAVEALRQRSPPAGAVVDLARREAAEWQRRAREAELAQREALAALAGAVRNADAFAAQQQPPEERGANGAEAAAAAEAEAATEAELQSQALLVADLAAQLEESRRNEAELREALRGMELLCGAHLHAREAAEAEVEALRLAARGSFADD